MNRASFNSTRAGSVFRSLEGFDVFCPNPLPPDLHLSWNLAVAISEADRRISALEGAASKLANPHLLSIPFSRKEAVLSSKIEGTMASLSDLVAYEALGLLPGEEQKLDDVKEVANYVNALEYGIEQIATLPISHRLIREMHRRLMSGVRGEDLQPGEFRTRQNWIGARNTPIEKATYVPPPVLEMAKALDDLEKYLHMETRVPPLVKLALVHYQFEAIHPFLDGNGRIGRLLMTLLLITEQVLSIPLLYLSAYFERNKGEYYRLLLAVSQEGRWEEWLLFFLSGVAEQAADSLYRATRLQDLKSEYRARMTVKRAPAQLLSLVDDLFVSPVVTVKRVQEKFKLTARSAQQYIDRAKEASILREVTGRQRYRVYIATEILSTVD